MRHTRVRRRFKFALIMLLAATLLLFFESRIEAFAPEFKTMAESRIEGIFGNDLNVSVGSLDGGVIRPFALRDVSISNKKGDVSGKLFEIKTVVSNYRIWDFILSGLLHKAPYIAVEFVNRTGDIKGSLAFEGDGGNVTIGGDVSLFGKEKAVIHGSIKNGIIFLVLTPDTGSVKVKVNFAADGILLINLFINHIKFHEFDIAGEAVIKNISVNNPADGNGGSFEGEIEATKLILNYKPFDDLKASYSVSSGVLNISRLDMCNLFFLSGKLGLNEPNFLDIQAVTDNINLSQTLSIFNPRYASFVSGTLNSKWEFKGTLKNPKSKVRLELKKGSISGMDFDFMSATLKGEGPVVRIEESRISRKSGYVSLAGEMDMRYLGKDIFFGDLKILEGEKAILWDGWDTAKWQDVREFRMKKKVLGDINVEFKKFINEDRVGETMEKRDGYEVSYNLHPNDSLKIGFRDSSPFFGLEHKDKF